MSSDIQPGDVVVCVDGGPIPCPQKTIVRNHTGARIKKGRLYRVRFVGPTVTGGRHNYPGISCGCISLVAECGATGLIGRFRKLNDEPDNAELVTRIKRCQPMKERQPC